MKKTLLVVCEENTISFGQQNRSLVVLIKVGVLNGEDGMPNACWYYGGVIPVLGSVHGSASL